MITRTVEYIDFDNKAQSDQLCFHLTKDDLVENMDIKEELEELRGILEGGEKRELSISDIQFILRFIKRFFRISYGEKYLRDGRTRFRKKLNGVPIWDDFVDSAAYEKFMDDLFADPASIFVFIQEIMPPDLIEQAQKELEGTTTVEGVVTSTEPARQKTPEELEAENAELRARLTAG